MAKSRRHTQRPAAQKPVDAATGAPLVRKYMLKLVDREDGKAADWPLIAETLLAVAFDALDQSPDDPRALALLRRVNVGAYERMAAGSPEGNQGGAEKRASITADFQMTQPGPANEPK